MYVYVYIYMYVYSIHIYKRISGNLVMCFSADKMLTDLLWPILSTCLPCAIDVLLVISVCSAVIASLFFFLGLFVYYENAYLTVPRARGQIFGQRQKLEHKLA